MQLVRFPYSSSKVPNLENETIDPFPMAAPQINLRTKDVRGLGKKTLARESEQNFAQSLYKASDT